MKWENEVEKALKREGSLTVDKLLDAISPQYAMYREAICISLVSMREYGAHLAAEHEGADLIPKLRTLTASMAVFWLGYDDAAEMEYLDAFDHAVRQAEASGQSPVPTQQMMTNIFGGLDLTIAEMNACGDLDEGIEECEDLKASLTAASEPQMGGMNLG